MVRKVKVLSIKEPYATLICNKKKSIETGVIRQIIEENYIFMQVYLRLTKKL